MPMLKVLAFDCAGRGCSAAVLVGDRVAAHRSALMERGQASALAPMIGTVMAEATASGAVPDHPEGALTGLDLIAVTVGPGAFTGLRIGLAMARGLAFAAELPVLGVTSFAAVAASVPPEARAGRPLVVALDSRRAELFLQVFAPEGPSLGDGGLVAPADFAARVPAGPLLLAGDGAPRLAAGLAGRMTALVSGPGVPDAVAVARLGAAAWLQGGRQPLPEPLYLRPPDTTAPRRSTAGR